MSEQETEIETEDKAADSEATKETQSDDKASKAKSAGADKADGDDKSKTDAAAEDAKTAEADAEKAGAEESVSEIELKYPEALGEVDKEVDADLKAFVKEAGLSQEFADKGVALFAKAFEVANKKVMASHEEAKIEGMTALKEEHGKAFKEKAGAVKAFLKERGGDDLVKFMDDTGGSTVPLLFNFLSKIAADYASDSGIKSPAREAGKPQHMGVLLYDHPESVKLASGQN